jgi:hypothetical protein
MKAVLSPFEDPAAVQKNLVTRNGEVEKELERMRMLLIRVAGRVAQLPDADGDGDEVTQDMDMLEKKKVDNLLDGL